MKLLGTALCLISLAVNAALGFSGGSLICKHETGDSHLVSKADHESGPHLQLCHSEANDSAAFHAPDEACNSCSDTEIENKHSLDKAQPSVERSNVKAPLQSDYLPAELQISLVRPRWTAMTFPARAPPFAATASAHYRETVQLLL